MTASPLILSPKDDPNDTPDHSEFSLAHEREPIEIDWRYLHYRRDFGAITVMLTWNFHPECGDDGLMLLGPSRWEESRLKEGDVPIPCVILREDAWRWSRTHNSETEMAGERRVSGDKWQEANAAFICMQLDLDPTVGNQMNRVRSLIEDHLEDLIMLPPRPDRDNPDVATFTVTSLSTGRTDEIEIKD